jgi:hypothetical protein
MSHIFISYARKDQPLAEKIAARLETAGFNPWIDLKGIGGGNLWRERIVEAIRTSDIFTILVTPESVQSKQVRRELNIADRANRKILPLLTGNVEMPGDFEFLISEINWIWLAMDIEDGLAQMVHTVEQHYLEQVEGIWVQDGNIVMAEGLWDENSPIAPMEISQNSAVVIETQKTRKVLGSGRHLLRRGERIKTAVDLGPHFFSRILVLETRDHSFVKIQVDVSFQVQMIDGRSSGADSSYRFNEQAVLKLVYDGSEQIVDPAGYHRPPPLNQLSNPSHMTKIRRILQQAAAGMDADELRNPSVGLEPAVRKKCEEVLNEVGIQLNKLELTFTGSYQRHHDLFHEGQRYRVRQEFQDTEGRTHPAGEEWMFIGCSIISDREITIIIETRQGNEQFNLRDSAAILSELFQRVQ